MISNLKVNHLLNPKFIDVNELSFSFLSNKNSGEFLVFLSKKQDFSESVETKKITYKDHLGFSFDSKLDYGQKYFWKVVSDIEESDIQSFETSPILEGKYIGVSKDFPKNKCPVFFKNFNVDKKISRALLSVTGLGLYEAYINGKRLGNSFLNPGYNDYDDYLRYQTYDVTDFLTSSNKLIFSLSNFLIKTFKFSLVIHFHLSSSL